MYNYFIKKDPDGGPEIMAWIAISIFLGFFLLNIFGVSSIILNKEMLPSSIKDGRVLMSVILFSFTYFLLFHVMKLKNIGKKDGNYFTITRNISRTVWAVYLFNILFFVIMVLVKKTYFGI